MGIALGHVEMDRQHRTLIDGIAFIASSVRRRDRDIIEWKRLLEEIEAHFVWEEGEMERVGFPDLEVHREDHLRQAANLREHLGNIEDGCLLDRDTFDAIAVWNVRHINSKDREFVEFVSDPEVWQMRRELREWEDELFLLDVG